MNTKASEIIDAIGGTDATAKHCQVVKSAVSNWRNTGIPPMTYRFLMLTKKRLLSGIIDPYLAQSIIKGLQ